MIVKDHSAFQMISMFKMGGHLLSPLKVVCETQGWSRSFLLPFPSDPPSDNHISDCERHHFVNENLNS